MNFYARTAAHPTLYDRLGRTIREQREFMGMDRAALAAAIGCSAKAIYRYEIGHCAGMSLRILIAIADALELEVSELWGMVDGYEVVGVVAP
jgi:transcriptional regulator with XRE-family HTH domain